MKSKVRKRPKASDEVTGAELDVLRLRRVQRISLALDLDAFAGGIIVDLLEEIERMRRDLDRLRAYGGF